MKSIAIAVALLVTTACSGVGQSPTSEPSIAPIPPPISTPEPTLTPIRPTLTATAYPEAPAANVCSSPQVDWSQLPAIAQSYGRAWNERDDAERASLLEKAMTEQASYVDLTTDEPVVGPEGIARMIGEFHDGFGDVYFEPLPWAESDQHHDRIRMRWRLCDPDGSVVWIGADFATIENGRISAISGFFNEPAAFEIEDECTGPASTDHSRFIYSTGFGAKPANTDWSRVPDVILGYGDAWISQGNLDRDMVLDEIWAEDGYYVDPFVEAPLIGRWALNEHIGMALGEEREPGLPYFGSGHYFEFTAWTENNMHHGHVWIPWRHCCPTGATLLEGDDLGEIDTTGKLSRVTSFWNDEVELTADVACK